MVPERQLGEQIDRLSIGQSVSDVRKNSS
jgi:hypothetical protein